MRVNPLIALIPLAVGLGIGALLPRERTMRIEFRAGGQAVRVDDGAWRATPAWITIPWDRRLILTIVNHDSNVRTAGVASVPGRDSLTTPLDQCAPGTLGRPVIPLR